MDVQADLTVPELDGRFCVDVYNRQPVVLVSGEGCRVRDQDGKSYLDWVAGIAVDVLGHSHPRWVAALRDQAQRLVHTSNLFYNEHQAVLARELVQVSGMDRAFFTNSGAEANEAAIKIARKLAKVRHGDGCFRVISFCNSFHGRTFGSLSATAQEKYQKPFEPLVPGFSHVPYGDLEALDQQMDGTVCAVILEPIQGEGGLTPMPPESLMKIRELCDERGVLMIVDEVQTGMGRTGRWFCYQHAGVLPDLVPVAKGLGAGFPIGACLARGEAATVLSRGEHGTTFGGSPLATRIGLEVIATIRDEGLVERASVIGELLRVRLKQAVELHGLIAEVRGMGLMIGVELTQPIARRVVTQALGRGLLVNAVSDRTLRIVPPLILSEIEVDEGIAILISAILASANG